MYLFGLIYGIVFVVLLFISQFVKNVKSDINKKADCNNEYGIYTDWDGRQKTLKGNIPVHFCRDENNDYIMNNCRTGETIRNISKEKRDIENKGKRIIRLEDNRHEHDKCVGMRYKDTETGEILVKRRDSIFSIIVNDIESLNKAEHIKIEYYIKVKDGKFYDFVYTDALKSCPKENLIKFKNKINDCAGGTIYINYNNGAECRNL